MRRKVIKQLRKLEYTAYHEAGHALACYLMKRRFEKVSIIKDKSSIGRIEITSPDLIKTDSYASIVISLAGIQAEKIHLFNSKKWFVPKIVYSMRKKKAIECMLWGVYQDGKNILNALNYLDGQEYDLSDDNIEDIFPEHQSIIQEAKEYTVKILKENWPALEALVAELIVRREIHYLNACKIMKRAMNESK